MNILLAILAALYIPQSNDATLSQTPLNQGETAFIMRDGAATLTIGGADVVDRTALRGYEVTALDRADYVVTVDGGFTYDGDADKWTLATTGGKGLTNHVVITTLNDIYDTTCTANWTAGFASNTPKSSRDITGSTATYTLIWPTNTVNAVISAVTASVVSFGDSDTVTDLTSHKFHVLDTIGSSYLGDWRSWAKNLYNGNRGEHWSKYPAVQAVDLAGNSVAFDTKSHYTFGLNTDTNLIFTAGGFTALEVSHHGSSIDSNQTLKVTSFAVTNLTCYIGFSQDIKDFDISKLYVMETYSLTKPIIWTTVKDEDLASKTDGLVVVKPQTGYVQRFLKLVYNGEIETEIVTVTFNGFVNVVGDLAINNTNLVAWMASVDAPLTGQSFDFSTMKGMYLAVSNIVDVLGGKVENFPEFK